MDFEIDKKKLPLVSHRGASRPNSKRKRFPFLEMRIGDSFTIEFKVDKKKIKQHRSNVLNSAKIFSKRTGSTFRITTRLIENGLRIFRIE